MFAKNGQYLFKSYTVQRVVLLADSSDLVNRKLSLFSAPVLLNCDGAICFRGQTFGP